MKCVYNQGSSQYIQLLVNKSIIIIIIIYQTIEKMKHKLR